MKKLHSIAFYALVTPVITLGAGSALAEQTSGQDVDRQQQDTQREQQGTMQSGQSEQSTPAGQSQSQAAADQQENRDQSGMQNKGEIGLSSAPANGMRASHLIGSEINTTGDEEVGSVSDLIIDQNGQIVAVVVGVGGFLGMGEKDVAIGWDHLKTSGTGEEQELRVDLTRDDLQSAPEFAEQD